MSFAVVLAGGAMPERPLVAGAGNAEIVIAADGGVRIARSHGLPIHLVIGDLDSISPGDLAWAKAEGAGIVSFSPDKDFTDLELALERADQSGVERIVATGVEGGRLDHELGNWAALCARRSALVEVHTANGTATILHGDGNNRVTQTGEVGDIISLLPRAGDAAGITTEGLRWPLENATLSSTGTHGISNEFVSASATVELQSGILMVVRPTVRALDD
jgi:thiamine pyrophosphokinase